MIPSNRQYHGVGMSLKHILLAILLPLALVSLHAGEHPQADRHRATAKRMLEWTTADKGLYPLLADFTDHYPKRLSGSQFLERGLDWIIAKMKA